MGKEFKRTTGHINVPHTENTKLYSFIIQQRRHYVKYTQGENTNFTEEQVKALESIDFQWESSKNEGPKQNRHKGVKVKSDLESRGVIFDDLKNWIAKWKC